jgi:GntR family transcriptional regulator
MAQQPMYQQIAEDLRKRIALGATLDSASEDPTAFKPGSQLPTELELCESYSASRNTIRDAIKRLIGQGLIETRPGQGTFVRRKIDPFVTVLSPNPDTRVGGGGGGEEGATYLSVVAEQHRKARAGAPRVEVIGCSRAIALRLRVTPGDQVVTRHQRRYIDEIPWSLQTSFYPWEFITKGATRLLMAENIDEGAVKYLSETLGLDQIGYRDWVTARGPDGTEQAFFELAHDATMFELFRTAFDQNGKPTRVTVTVYPVDRNQFVFNFGDVPEIQYEEAEKRDDK